MIYYLVLLGTFEEKGSDNDVDFSNHGNVDPPIKKMEKKKSCAGVADIRSFFKRK